MSLVFNGSQIEKIKDTFDYRPTPPHPIPSNKTFLSFQKGRFTLVFLKPQTPFTTPIKPKLKTIGPLRSCKADSLRGIKHFRVSKTPFYSDPLKTVSYGK